MKTRRPAAPEPCEHQLQKQLIARLVRAGWVVVRVNSGAFKTSGGQWFRAYTVAGLNASSGFPDVLAVRADVFGNVCARLFEVKLRAFSRFFALFRALKSAKKRGANTPKCRFNLAAMRSRVWRNNAPTPLSAGSTRFKFRLKSEFEAPTPLSAGSTHPR